MHEADIWNEAHIKYIRLSKNWKIVNSFLGSVTAFVIIDDMGEEGIIKNQKKVVTSFMDSPDA